MIAACRQPGRANALNTLAGDHPGRLHVLPLDLARPHSHQELARELPLVLGQGARLELLVNNAGVLHSGERLGSLSAANFEDSFRVNAIGPLLLTQTLEPLLADGARVVNLSSSLGAIALAGPPDLARATVATMRVKRFKIGASVVRNTRRIRIFLASHHLQRETLHIAVRPLTPPRAANRGI